MARFLEIIVKIIKVEMATLYQNEVAKKNTLIFVAYKSTESFQTLDLLHTC
jgi:hypothetical protein